MNHPLNIGLRHADGTEDWGDAEGELALAGTYVYAGNPIEVARNKVTEHNRRHPATPVTLISRTVTYGPTVEVGLPTTPNSLIRATANDNEAVFVLTDSSVNPWFITKKNSGESYWFSPDELTLIEVLYEAPATSEEGE